MNDAHLIKNGEHVAILTYLNDTFLSWCFRGCFRSLWNSSSGTSSHTSLTSDPFNPNKQLHRPRAGFWANPGICTPWVWVIGYALPMAFELLGCILKAFVGVICWGKWGSKEFKISRRRSPTAVGFKQWSNFATQDGLMMAGTGFHSLSLFGDFLPALPRPLLDQRQDETCSLRKRA